MVDVHSLKNQICDKKSYKLKATGSIDVSMRYQFLILWTLHIFLTYIHHFYTSILMCSYEICIFTKLNRMFLYRNFYKITFWKKIIMQLPGMIETQSLCSCFVLLPFSFVSSQSCFAPFHSCLSHSILISFSH